MRPAFNVASALLNTHIYDGFVHFPFTAVYRCVIECDVSKLVYSIAVHLLSHSPTFERRIPYFRLHCIPLKVPDTDTVLVTGGNLLEVLAALFPPVVRDLGSGNDGDSSAERPQPYLQPAFEILEMTPI